MHGSAPRALSAHGEAYTDHARRAHACVNMRATSPRGRARSSLISATVLEAQKEVQQVVDRDRAVGNAQPASIVDVPAQ